jgi:hypothetical protein
MTTTALTPSDALKSFLDVYRAPAPRLFAILRESPAPSFDDLLGWEFNGLNVGPFAGALGLNRKFRKGFYQGPARAPRGPEPFIQGYNIPIVQDGAERPHRAKPSDEAPGRFAFYRAYGAAQSPRFNRYPQALLLDYSLGGDAWPPPVLRDYLVQVHPGSSELLLGYACLALGPITLPGGFFVLERTRRHDFAG